MATDGHHLLGMRGAVDLPDHVGAGVLTVHAHIKIQMHHDRLVIAQNAFKLVGIGIGQCRRRYGPGRVGETGHAGMRNALMGIGTGRTQKIGGRALARRQGRSGHADRRADTIVATVPETMHAFADIDDATLDLVRIGLLQRIQVLETDHLRRQPARGSRRRVAQGAQHQLLRKRRHDRARFVATHPFGIAHRFGPDLVESQLPEARHDPVPGTLVIGTTGQTRSDLGAQVTHEVPGSGVVKRPVAQLRGRADRCLADAGLVGRMHAHQRCTQTDGQYQHKDRMAHALSPEKRLIMPATTG